MDLLSIILIILMLITLGLGLFLFWYSYKNLRHVQKQEAQQRRDTHDKTL